MAKVATAVRGMAAAAAAAAVIAGCGSGTKGQYTRQTTSPFADPTAARDKLVTELLELTAAHDDRSLAHMLATPLGYGGLWFPDTGCRRKLGAAGLVPESGIDIFASCLSQLPLERSARTHQFPDVAVLSYAPGLEIEALFDPTDGGHVTWLGFAGRRALKDALPTVTQESLLALRNDVPPLVIDDATRAEIARGMETSIEPTKDVFAWLKVCVDATGAVTGVYPRLTSSLAAQEAFVAWARTWSFRPYKLGDQPSPVCSLIYLDEPAGTTTSGTAMPPPVPPEHATAIVVPPGVLGPLLEGTREPAPDASTRDAITDAGGTSLAIVMFCLDDIGKIAGAPMLMRSSKVPAYDKFLLAQVATWRFAPLALRGAPVRACSHVTFGGAR